MDDSTVTSLATYYELEQKKYDYLTPVEQKIVRLGAAALAKPIGTIIACQSAMDEHKRLKQMDDYSKMNAMLESFLSQLEIAIAFRSSTIL
ncbi:hypothetical protein [Chamaesiphon polymorphus]|uniref:Uncharacterized protein n=1 Tax=Chamaesiphon polymorphus CCALA 037 TaxID=2107692 RepID=A0A2T1FRY5_9CYAN|nr:hypothetical protein [Chamaesiphon polymorphus]PSB47748.1 hypothetical protein C7B77_24180 [Chamaesiphon polymorphus CCALA 037]